MDRNTVTGFVLIFAMVIVYQLYFVPAPEPQAATTSQTSVTPEATDDATEIPTASNNVQDSTYVAKTGVLAWRVNSAHNAYGASRDNQTKNKKGTAIENSIADEERSEARIQKESVAAADSVVGITGFGAVPGRV